jgi:hypothetical protein
MQGLDGLRATGRVDAQEAELLGQHVVAPDATYLRGRRDAQRLTDGSERDIHIALAGPGGQHVLTFDFDVPLLQGHQGRLPTSPWLLTRHA